MYDFFARYPFAFAEIYKSCPLITQSFKPIDLGPDVNMDSVLCHYDKNVFSLNYANHLAVIEVRNILKDTQSNIIWELANFDWPNPYNPCFVNIYFIKKKINGRERTTLKIESGMCQI